MRLLVELLAFLGAVERILAGSASLQRIGELVLSFSTADTAIQCHDYWVRQAFLFFSFDRESQ